MIIVPYVVGKSIREANKILISQGLRLKIEGSGIAVSQEPAAGTWVEENTEITVKFKLPGEGVQNNEDNENQCEAD